MVREACVANIFKSEFFFSTLNDELRGYTRVRLMRWRTVVSMQANLPPRMSRIGMVNMGNTPLMVTQLSASLKCYIFYYYYYWRSVVEITLIWRWRCILCAVGWAQPLNAKGWGTVWSELFHFSCLNVDQVNLIGFYQLFPQTLVTLILNSTKIRLCQTNSSYGRPCTIIQWSYLQIVTGE